MRDKQIFSFFVITFIILFSTSLISPFFSTSWTYDSENEFISTAISADGQYIIARSSEGYVYFFHKSNPEPLWSFFAGETVWNLAISSDGEYTVAGRYSKTFYVFNKNSSTPLWSFSGPTGYTISGLSISEDGQYIVGSIDRLYYFSIASSIPLWNTSIRGNTAISSNGYYLAISGGSKIFLLNKTSPLPLWNYDLNWPVSSIAISNNGDYIVAGVNQDEKIYFFHKSSSTPLWFYDAGQDITSVAISNNGDYIAAGSKNDYVYLFHKSSSIPLWQYLTNGEIYSVAISSDGTYICAWNYIHEVFLFHKSSSNPLWSFHNPDLSSVFEQLQHAISISSSGQYVTFVCNKLFLIDRLNPKVDINFITLIIENALGFGIPIIITFLSFLIIRKSIDKKIIKIKQEKEESEIYDVLDEQFKSWEDEDSKKKK